MYDTVKKSLCSILISALILFTGCSAEPRQSSAVDTVQSIEIIEETENTAAITTAENTEPSAVTPEKTTSVSSAETIPETDPVSETHSETVTETSPSAAIEKTLAVTEENFPSDSSDIYILNTNTHKFHKPSCPSASKMKESNREEFTGSREEVIEMGYKPCKNCEP